MWGLLGRPASRRTVDQRGSLRPLDLTRCSSNEETEVAEGVETDLQRLYPPRSAGARGPFHRDLGEGGGDSSLAFIFVVVVATFLFIFCSAGSPRPPPQPGFSLAVVLRLLWLWKQARGQGLQKLCGWLPGCAVRLSPCSTGA